MSDLAGGTFGINEAHEGTDPYLIAGKILPFANLYQVFATHIRHFYRVEYSLGKEIMRVTLLVFNCIN